MSEYQVFFNDGPAKGRSMRLGRAVIFLRVVVSPDGRWDALDQLDDEPKADEKIHVYRLRGRLGVVHIDRRDPKTGRRVGEWHRTGEYFYYDPQPADDQVRDTAAWREWTDARHTIDKAMKNTYRLGEMMAKARESQARPAPTEEQS